jgi:hypothetical protein
MANVLICYKFENMKTADRNKFKRKLFGSEEKTHFGRYTAITKGYLSNKKYKKPIRSVIIINEKDKKEVIKILEEFNAIIFLYKLVN